MHQPARRWLPEPAHVVVALMALASLGTVEAAEPEPIGERVRITAPSVSGRRLVGTLTAVSEAALTLWRPKEGPLEVPRSAVAVFEVSRQESRKGQGARRGALIGAGVALAVGVLAAADPCDGEWMCSGPAATAVGMALLTVPLGALVGLGAAPDEAWEVLNTPRVGVGVAPAHEGGVRAALVVRF